MTGGEKEVEEVALIRGPGPQSYVQADGVGRWDACASEPEPGTCIQIVGAGRLGVTRGKKMLKRSLASVAPDLNPTSELVEWGGGTLAPVSPNPAPASELSEQGGWA